MVPSTLEEWTLDVIRTVAEKGIAENDLFDLKADLQKPAERQRKVVAAFANTRGGFLVFGVTNERRIVGVDNKELPRDFGTKLTGGVEPSVEYAFAPPMDVGNGRSIFVCHIPRSLMGPHAVIGANGCTFVKRTPSGSNEAMTLREIRAAFDDSGRRRSELAWLAAEVERIRTLANTLNVYSSRGCYDLDLLLTKFDTSQLRTLLVSAFASIGTSETLIQLLHDLVERCTKVDAALAPMAEFAMRPRDRSYSRSRGDPEAVVRQHVPQIVMSADRALAQLESVTK